MELNVKTEKEYDIIVVGAGPAGCMAAVAAGRRGQTVLLIEKTGAPGGMATMGLVSKMAPFTDREKVIYKSLPLEMMTKYKAAAGIAEDQWRWVDLFPETLKRIYDELLTDAGVTVLYDTALCDVCRRDNRITGLIVANKAGLSLYTAKVYIDTTGDGDVCAFAGVPSEVGDEDGDLQAATLCFTIANIKPDGLEKRWFNSDYDECIWIRIINDGKYPLISRHFVTDLHHGCMIINGGHLYNVDATDPKAISRAMTDGRKVAEQYHAALKEYLPEQFGDSELIETAPVLGVRESRRICGRYTLTIADYRARRKFEDDIAYNSYWLDCHSSKDRAFKPKSQRESMAPGESHGIPFRCLVPVGVDNLLMAGRCISAERAVNASVRVMPNCLATGEAAGIAAALAVQKGVFVSSIDGKAVAAELK